MRIYQLPMALPMILLNVVFTFLFVIGAEAANDPGFTAKIYDSESNKQKLLFTYHHASEIKGDVRTITNTYKDKDGGIAAIETVEFVKDGEHEKVRRYHMSQKQLAAEGDVEVKDGKVLFTYKVDGSEKKAEEKLTDDFVVGPAVTAYLQRNWATIVKGDKVKVRFAVPDRKETVGFEYFKEREEMINGTKTFVIKMKPSSFLIAALVKPLYFFYTVDGEKMVEVHGRTQVKQNVSGSWKNLDGVTVYEYEEAPIAAGAK